MRRAFVAIVLTMGCAVVVGACRAPTEAQIVVTTRATCAEVADVSLTVGPDPGTAESRVAAHAVSAVASQCDGAVTPTSFGSLVVTPGDGPAGAVVVVAATGGKHAVDCIAPLYAGCIVARRSFAFIEHATLTIPILLDPLCVDVPCDANTTCRDGFCYGATVTCDQNGTCLAPGELADGGSDPDAALVLDGSLPRDASVDVAPDVHIPPTPDAGPQDASIDVRAPPPDASAPGATCNASVLQCNGTACGAGQNCCVVGFSTTVACAAPTSTTCAGLVHPCCVVADCTPFGWPKCSSAGATSLGFCY